MEIDFKFSEQEKLLACEKHEYTLKKCLATSMGVSGTGFL